MEYEFKRGICTVRYALAGLLRREWSFAYNDTTIFFGHMPPMSAALATVPEYGFSDGEGNVLFRTKQAMKVENFDYFGLVVSGYLARNEDEEKSRRAIASIRLERNLRDKSASEKMWIFLGIVIAISATMSVIDIRSKPTENERLAVKAVIEAFYNGGDYRAVAEAQKVKCRKRAPGDIDEAVEEAFRAERGCKHSAMIHSTNVHNMSKAAKRMNTTIFVKNAPSYSGLGFDGEGFTTMTIATPTGEGVTSARTFTRLRRCVLYGDFRIV